MNDPLANTLIFGLVGAAAVLVLLAWKGPATVRAFLRKSWHWLTGAFVLLLGLLTGGKYWARRRRARAEAEAQAAEKRLAELAGADAEMAREGDRTEAEIAYLEKERTELKREVLEKREGVTGLTDEEVVDEFRSRYGGGR